jgi:hypothetical protein
MGEATPMAGCFKTAAARRVTSIAAFLYSNAPTRGKSVASGLTGRPPSTTPALGAKSRGILGRVAANGERSSAPTYCWRHCRAQCCWVEGGASPEGTDIEHERSLRVESGRAIWCPLRNLQRSASLNAAAILREVIEASQLLAN